ncbi:MAG: hypothetical protein LQ340_000108 [Diploschistes diacapsis]|nr:MAG: hypothetical protein LQ340_000108 [Diploschistes diacapsis]
MTSDASATPSDQKTREEKSAPYRNPVYRIQLEKKNSYMNRYVGENEADVTETSKKLCQTLLQTKQTVPEDSMFADEFFQDTCEMLRDRNESKVIQDITRLIVPSAQSLAIRAIRGGSKNLKYLIESVNEGWNNSIPLIGRRPQPDYAVGLKRTAFTEEQLAKIEPIIGDIVTEMSLFMATYYMYFPFLTCEVKSGAAALDIADRQNAHSMTLAVRAIVELFRLGKREKEVHREIMAFSISHDHRTVRIYGHYPVIDGKRTIYYRHPIREFNFIELDSKDKWTAYKFTKNIYEVWMPEHLARIRSVLDELPSDINFEARPHSEATGLSQRFEGSHIARPLTEPGSLLGQSDTQPRIADQVATPSTSLTTPATSKRPKNNARAQT